ncbi:MAG: thermonuclease family protein [Rhodospirillaceae bacterium]|nr:thermonuclease family protein [Rhodospirillaceae bacterium]
MTRVIDGDTVAVDASANFPPELSRLRVRLRGVDTPEKGWRAKCPSEKKAGQAATAFTRRQIDVAKRKDRQIVVRDPKWGKYGGRVIADLVLDGKSLSALLIDAGHGRPYRHGKRQNWCPESGN